MFTGSSSSLIYLRDNLTERVSNLSSSLPKIFREKGLAEEEAALAGLVGEQLFFGDKQVTK